MILEDSYKTYVIEEVDNQLMTIQKIMTHRTIVF